MSPQLDDIPNLYDAPSEGYREASRHRVKRTWRLDRRRFLGSAVGVGIGAGLAVVGVFPAARRASANHEGSDPYQVFVPNNFLTCDGLNVGGDETCNVPCGPSKIHNVACEPDGHLEGWHKDTQADGWAIRRNECAGSTDPSADAWKWEPGGGCGCGGSQTARFRCHDGWDKHPGDNNNIQTWHKSICKKQFCV